MSVFSATLTTTPILKSANTSLSRKRIHDRIRNSVQFQLISENGLRNVLEDAAKGENVEAYQNYIRAMRDVDLSDADFGILIKESRQCIELLKPKFTLFVETIIGLNWIKRSERLIIEYQHFLIDLLSEHNKYTSFALRTLISFWIPNKVDEHLWKGGVPDAERIKPFLMHVHQTLRKIMEVIPMANDCVMNKIEKMFPYYTKASFIVAGYVYNTMWLLEYRPLFREDILLLLFKNLVLMDVSVRRIDIETAERVDTDAEEIFKMDADDVRNVDENEMRHPIAETIDICMERMCRFVSFPNELPVHSASNGTNASHRMHFDHLYKTLLKGFEEFILPTHKTNHIQFILFYFCSFKVKLHRSHCHRTRCKSPNLSRLLFCRSA